MYVEDFAFDVNGRHLLVTDAAHSYERVLDRKIGSFITRFGGKGARTTIWKSLRASR